MNRRKFIKWSGSILPFTGALPASAMSLIKNENSGIEKQLTQRTEEDEKADYSIHISTGLIE